MNGYGSICLSDIPREQMRKAENGKIYLNFHIREMREHDRYGNTHYLDCRPKKEEVREGVNYYFGKAVEWKPKEEPTVEQIGGMPAVQEDEELPF